MGWIGGRLGNRRLYLTSLSLYMVASMLCGLAWDLHSMIFFRVLQGMSAGYRTVINTGKDGGQTVFHLHLHLLSDPQIRGRFA